MKTYNSQARNIQWVHTATSAHWSQPWIKDCREINYSVPCLGLLNLQFSSTLTMMMAPGSLTSGHWSRDCICCLGHRLPAMPKGTSSLQDHNVIWPMEEDGNLHCDWVDYFLVLKQHYTINLKLGVFNFAWQSLKSIQSKELWDGSADIWISPT